ncbi:MAG: lytic transglycosylase domain-containing protein [Spirochaetes bacterium]|nr:lytic transglycosylase domain-containing protein [Spirochaetota bacterium]
MKKVNKIFFILFLIPAFSFQNVSADNGQIDFYEMSDIEVISVFSKSSNLAPEENYRLGLAYKNTGSTKAAFSSFVLSAFTKNLAYTDSYTYFNNKIYRSPHYNSALAQIIEILYSDYQYDTAIRLYSLLDNNDPVLFFNTALIISNCYSALNKLNKSVEILNSIRNISIKSNSFEKLRKLRLGGIFEKMDKPESAYNLYFSIIKTEDLSWEGNIAVRNIFRMIQNNQIKPQNQDRYLISSYLTSIKMFEESQAIISSASGMKFQAITIRNLCGLKKSKEAKNIISNNTESEVLLAAFAESLWKYSAKSDAAEFSESEELYKKNETILQYMISYYTGRNIQKAAEYLVVLEKNYRQNPENEKFYWYTAKEYIEKKNYSEALKILEKQINLYAGGTYYGNAVYWISKINKNINPEIYLKMMILNRPDSVYVFRLFDRISSNFNLHEYSKNFETAVSENNVDNMIYYHFILFCLEKDSQSKNRRIHTIFSNKNISYAGFEQFINSGTNYSFKKYSKILENYYNCADFSNITALENYLSYDEDYRKLSAKTIYKLYCRHNFYYQKYYYASYLLKLYNLHENISLLNRSIAESLYPLAYYDIVKTNCFKQKLDPLLILSLIRAESAYKPSAKSASDAKGLMQIMDNTAAELSRKTGLLEYNIFSPEDNIIFGTYYFNWLRNYFSGNMTFTIGAYNAGPSNMKKWQKQYDSGDEDYFIEKIPFLETRNYILKIAKYRSIYDKLY